VSGHLTENPPPVYRSRPSEAALIQWWFEMGVSTSGLMTTEGESLIILQCGVPNDGPGPDVLDASIALDGKIISGNVEMHQSANSWYQHGHENDPRYQQVILHVVSQTGNGPDLPTLQVSHRESTSICPAKRVITPDELFVAAADRYRQKLAKVNRWISCETQTWPVLHLGLLDVLAYGPVRKRLLNALHFKLGTYLPPADLHWSGSYQSRNDRSAQWDRLLKVSARLPHLPTINLREVGWQEFERSWHEHLRGLAVSKSLVREWVINWVVPTNFPEVCQGLDIWQDIPPARHYGFERKILAYTGMTAVRSALEQQGLLFWWQNGCQPRQCRICPLTRGIVRENLSNTLYDKQLANSSLVNYERIA